MQVDSDEDRTLIAESCAAPAVFALLSDRYHDATYRAFANEVPETDRVGEWSGPTW